MTTSELNHPDMFREAEQASIGLYIGLSEGGELDLRVAARAALSFDAFVRILVEQIEPGSEIELNLISGEIGSLNLISKIKAKVSKKTLQTLVLLASGWIGGEVLSFGSQEFLNYLKDNLTDEQVLEIGDETLKRLALECAKAIKSPELAAAHEELTATLAVDTDVVGVGLTVSGEKKPRQLMSRSDFPRVTLHFSNLQEVGVADEVRVTTSTVELILTEPVLIDKPRKWRFLLGKSEISATVSDEVFRQRALQGKLGVALSQGITIKAVIATTEEKLEADLWKPTKYEVLEVLESRPNPVQTPLPLSGDKEDSSDNQND